MSSKLPPTGSSLPLTRLSAREADTLLRRVFEPYEAHLLGSGTMALAAAIGIAARRSGRTTGEVLMPGYACPDLVAATRFVGLQPVLVDMASGSCGMDLIDLKAKLTTSTIAVIAAHLLGLREQTAEIMTMLADRPITVIEDSAQYFPAGGDAPWCADLVVLSFGRGKPVNAIGGGALLTRSSEVLPDFVQMVQSRINPATCGAMALAFNIVTDRRFYGLFSALPFLNVGETHFKPLRGVLTAADGFYRYLASCILRYQTADRSVATRLVRGVTELVHPKLNVLGAGDQGQQAVHSRLGVLAASGASRDRIVQDMSDAGLGASILYPASLDRIPGTAIDPEYAVSLGGATALGQRLFTLPAHDRVKGSDVERMLQHLSSADSD